MGNKTKMWKRWLSLLLAVYMTLSNVPFDALAQGGWETPDIPAVSYIKMSLRYDDRYDISGKVVEIVDAGTPTSYQVGYGVEENAILDTAVVTLEGDTLVATGIGTAKVRIDGTLYEVTVTAAPISLLLLAGQSNMQGSEGDANQSIVCPDGMVYATYGDRYTMTIDNATDYAVSALAGQYSSINVNGTTDRVDSYPIYALNEAGPGKPGPDSGFAYEWVKQTGEKVWIVNAAHGGTNINVWQPGTTEYEECQALFTACMETMRKEIAAGHFTLSHMAYFWCQGCANYSNTAEWYVQKYLTMHESFKSELSFDHDSDPATADKTFEFGGIIPVRAGHEYYTSYRQGTYTDTTTAAYHESFKDLRFTGPRVAQYWMINNPELSDIWGVCNIGEDWVWMPDGTNGVSAYFQEHYENGTVDYTTQVAQDVSWYTPTTPKAVHDSIHYNQIGYNEVGRESVRNALILLGEKEAPEAEVSVEFLTWDGYTQAEEIKAWTEGTSGSLVVPVVSPVYKSKEITYTVTDGLSYSYYDLLAETTQTEGGLTASTGERVSVVKQEPGAYFAEHLSQLPEVVCSGLNLWTLLEHDKEFYSPSSGWNVHSSGTVYSVTIPVQPGDKIFATSFGKGGENGHASSNGIRCTFFGEYEVVKTLAPADTYKEFAANGGYLIAPEGAVAVNVPMWTNDDTNELYILNLPHDRTEGICGICGKDSHVHSWGDWETVSLPTAEAMGIEQRSCTCGETETQEVEGVWQKYALADHMQTMPDAYCAGTNLWTALEHESVYFASGTSWAAHSSGKVYSVTIPVAPGDKIFATAFGKAGENGHTSYNGIRCTFFGAYDVVKTLAPSEVYPEFTANGGYLVAPEGAIAVNVPMWNGSDDNELYILSAEHDYSGTVCTICGAEHPNAANYSGKVISILGDSISTFAGYIPVADGFNLEHLARYPQDNLLTDVNETWWMQVIAELGGKLGINDSWRGATVSGAAPVTTGTTGENAAMANLTRLQNLGSNGTPDVILFYGGTNDLAHVSKVGTFDPETAPTTVDLTTTKWDNLADGYVHTLLRLKHYYPDAVILAMLPTYTTSYYSNDKLAQANTVLAEICQHYGVPYVDLRHCGITTADLPDGIHPDANGMDFITDAVLGALLETNVEAGENVVYSVTHTLTDAKASLGHYKGISAGEAFTETITGDDVTVSVTMGGADITTSAYADGKINIASVTGDLVITARGEFTADGHLQQLPESLCAGTNLWTALAHDAQYYTVSGWGVHSSGKVFSVTFPVSEGDQVYATSFGKAGENGSSINGIRVTWFKKDGGVSSVSTDEVYTEFAANGYLTAPEGAIAVCVPMWTPEDSNELYILSAEHDYESVITAPTCTEKGYATHTCTICGGSYVDSYVDARGYDWMIEDGQFNLLLIGNSFSEDASNAGMPNSQMLDILQAMLGEDVSVTVGLCYSGGKGLNWHATQSEQGNSSYSLRIISSESGKWKSLGSYTSADALTWTDWDVVSLQHYEINTTTGKESNAYPDQVDPKFDQLKPATEFMLDYVDQYAPDAAIYFYMHWARAYKSNLNESLAAYNKMAAFFPVVLDYAGTESNRRFETIIPVGLSVQNARTTYLAKLAYNTTAYADGNLNLTTDAQIGLQRDTGHLSFNVGRYIAALTFAETILPQQLRQENYVLPDIRITESVGQLPKEYTILAQKAVAAAVDSWLGQGSLAVTTIAGYEEDPTVAAAAKLAELAPEISCAGNTTQLKEKISQAVEAVLDADFAVDTVTLPEDFVLTGQEQAFTAAVTIRFGYTSKDVQINGTISASHDYESVVTAPTCTEKGYTTHTCTICGGSYVDGETEAAGHSYAYAVEKEPTLTEEGTLTGTCGACGDVTSVALPKLDELVYTYAVTKEPTYTETGTATYTWKEETYGTITITVVLEKREILYGDVNGDGEVTGKDRTILARYLAEWDGYTEEDIDLLAADVNQDGEVTGKDRTILARHLAEWIGYEELPYTG